MEEAEGLAYDDLWSDSDAMVTEVDGSQGPALSLHDEARFVVELMVVVIVKINKAVVGSHHGDMPKYVGEGVALCRMPGTLGVPSPCYSHLSMAVLGNFGWACFR